MIENNYKAVAELFKKIGGRANVPDADHKAILEENLFPFLDGAFAKITDDRERGSLLAALRDYQPGLRHEKPGIPAYDQGFPETIEQLEPGQGVSDEVQNTLLGTISQILGSYGRPGEYDYARAVNPTIDMLAKYEGKFSQEQLTGILLHAVKRLIDEDSRANYQGIEEQVFLIVEELVKQGVDTNAFIDGAGTGKFDDILGQNFCITELPLKFLELDCVTFENKSRTVQDLYNFILEERVNSQGGF